MGIQVSVKCIIKVFKEQRGKQPNQGHYKVAVGLVGLYDIELLLI